MPLLIYLNDLLYSAGGKMAISSMIVIPEVKALP